MAKKTQSVIVINTNGVERKDININDLKVIYKELNCTIFTATYLKNGTCIFVDDEGMMNLGGGGSDGTKPKGFGFTVGGGHQPYFGYGIIVGGTDDEGNTLGYKGTIKDLNIKVGYLRTN